MTSRDRCPAPSVNGAHFTGSAIGDGGHSVRLVAEDAAGNTGVIQRTVRVDGTPPSVILDRARGRTIVLGVTDANSGVASATLEVRNNSSEPYRTLQLDVRRRQAARRGRSGATHRSSTCA